MHIIQLMKFLYAFYIVLVLLMLPAAMAGSENISILDPQPDDVFAKDFPATVYVNDTNVKSVQVRIVGYPWLALDQTTSFEWTGTISIADLADGDYQLSARYTRNGEIVPSYVSATTKISIKRPPVIPQYGILSVTIRDANNNPLQGVAVSPSGNITDSAGVAIAGQQPLNTQINFSFTKAGYYSSYLLFTFLDNNTVFRTITMSQIPAAPGAEAAAANTSGLKDLDVKGYKGLIGGRGVYVFVNDMVTGEKIDGALITIYEGALVKSIPGETVNGRLFVSVPQADSSVVEAEYLIEVSKKGYKDYVDSFRVIYPPAPTPSSTPVITPTPTPTIAPTPEPTPPEKYRADANMKLTDDEYREWLAAQETKKSQDNANKTPMVSQPFVQPQPEGTQLPWGLLGVGGLAVGAVAYKKYAGRKGTTGNLVELTEAGELQGFEKEKEKEIAESAKTQKIACDLCEWTMNVDPNSSDELKTAIIAAHKKEMHSTKRSSK